MDAAASGPGAKCKDRQYYESKRYYASKWVTFSAAAVLMLCAGLPYSFGVYGSALQDALDYSQRQIAGVGTASNLGGYFAIFAGLFYDRMKRYKRYGPRLCALVGAALISAGFFGLYGAATRRFDAPYWLVIVFAVLANNGGCWLESAALVTTLRNFETERGTVVGLLKSFLGLSASLYTTLYVTFVAPDTLKFLLLLAIVPAALTVLVVWGINYVPFVQVEPHTKSHAFHMSLIAVLSLAAYQLVSALFFAREWQQRGKPPSHDVALMLCVAVAGLLLPVLCIPGVFGGLRAVPLEHEFTSTGTLGALEAELAEEDSKEDTSSFFFAPGFASGLPAPHGHDSRSPWLGNASQPLLGLTVQHQAFPFGAHAGSAHNADSESEAEAGVATDRAQLTPLQCLRTVNFWLVCVTTSIVSGSGLAFINNVGSLVAVLDGERNTAAVIVSVYSAASCLGRLTTAFVPEKAFRKLGFARTNFLSITSLTCAAACFLNAYYTLATLPLCSFFTGYVFGFVQGLAPAIVSEVFGLAYFASNYAMMNTGLIAGSFAIANLLMSAVYDHHTRSGQARCSGLQCFQAGFLVCAALCVLGTLCSVALTMRTQQLYRKLRRAILRERRKRGVTGLNRQKDFKIRLMQQQLKHASWLLAEAEQRVHEIGEELHTRAPDTRATREQDGAGPSINANCRLESSSLGAWIPAMPEIDGAEITSAGRSLQRKFADLRSKLNEAAETLDPGAAAERGYDDDVESLASTQV